jgi:putative nucleotidyltransferase with HDIG domain
MEDALQKAVGLRARSKAMVASMFREARMGNTLDTSRCVSLVNEVVESVNRNSDVFVSLAGLKVADEYTYMHSVAVCALMVALAGELGFTDAQCCEAAMAGLLHDPGKAAMPQELINKPGMPTAAEFEIIKTHPRRGHEMLLAAGTPSEGTLDVCLHHHERMDGTGYPGGLPGEQLTLLARMGPCATSMTQ